MPENLPSLLKYSEDMGMIELLEHSKLLADLRSHESEPCEMRAHRLARISPAFFAKAPEKPEGSLCVGGEPCYCPLKWHCPGP